MSLKLAQLGSQEVATPDLYLDPAEVQLRQMLTAPLGLQESDKNPGHPPQHFLSWQALFEALWPRQLKLDVWASLLQAFVMARHDGQMLGR